MHMRLISILVKNHKCFAIMQIMSMAKPILCLAMLVYLQNDFVFIIGRVKLQISILRQKFCMVWIFIEQIKAISEPSLPPKIMLNVNANIKARSLYEAIVRHGVSGQVRRSCFLYTLCPAPASKVLITAINSIKLRSWLLQLKHFAAWSRQILLGYLIISMKNKELLSFTQYYRVIELLSCSQMAVREERLQLILLQVLIYL